MIDSLIQFVLDEIAMDGDAGTPLPSAHAVRARSVRYNRASPARGLFGFFCCLRES